MIRHFVSALKSQWLATSVLALVIGTHLCYSWQAVCPFEGHFADGPFQYYDALRRLDLGQLPGRDFPAFHGLGIPIIGYPLYRVVGRDLIGSELTRQLVCRLAAIAVYLLTSYLLTGSLWPGILWLIFYLGCSLFPIPLIVRFFNLSDFDAPGNSLLSFRSLLPVLSIGLVYRCATGWRGALLLGMALAAAWLLGVEQSLALAGSFLITGLTASLVCRFREARLEWPPLLTAVVFGAIFTIASATILAGSRLLDVLRYYFVLIPNDQIWYFGAPPNHFIGDGTMYSLSRAIVVLMFGLAFAVLWCWCIWQDYLATEPDRSRVVLATAVGAGYALLSLTSNFGYLNGGYLAVPTRIALVLGTVWAARRVGPHWNSLYTRFANLTVFRAGSVILLGAWLVWLLAIIAARRAPAISEPWQSVATNFASKIRADVPQPATGTLWSTYAGIVEDRLQIFQPNLDYIIHALGEQRDKYVEYFAELRPPFVQTMRRDAFQYEEWVQSSTWGFYDRLIANYDIVGVSDFSMLWRRNDQVWAEPPNDSKAWTKASFNQQGVTIRDVPADGNIAVFHIEYQVENPLRRVPVIGVQPRYLVTSEGTNSAYPVSLPPSKTSWEFPVFVRPGTPFSLRFKVLGLGLGASLRVTDVSVRYIKLREPDMAFLDLALFHNR